MSIIQVRYEGFYIAIISFKYGGLLYSDLTRQVWTVVESGLGEKQAIKLGVIKGR